MHLHPRDRRQSDTFTHTVREHVEQLLASEHFDGSARSRDFLCFIVEEMLAGRGDALTQSVIATRVFGRNEDFDAILDPVVRVQAGRLRRSLERYYLLTGDGGVMRIELPKGSYAPRFCIPSTQSDVTHTEIRHITIAPAAPGWPTLSVCPFDATSPETSARAARFEDMMIMELGRYQDLRVVRRRDIERLVREHESMRFELRGTLRSQSEHWLITTCVIDRFSGEQVWGDEYRIGATATDDDLDDIARIIAARVGAEHGVVVRLLASERRGVDTTAAGFGAMLNCYHFFFTRQISELPGIMQTLEKFTTREPEIAVAWAYLARLYQINHCFELTDADTPLEKAIGYAYQAAILEPTSSRIRCILAASLLCKGELQASRDALGMALRHNASSLAYREIIGWLLALSGEWERGTEIMRDAMKRNPYCLPHVGHGLWADSLRRGDFEQAYVAALEYRDTAFYWRDLMITCCLGHLGRVAEARSAAAELLRIKPGFLKRGRTLIGYYIKPPELRDRVAEGLRKAGVMLA